MHLIIHPIHLIFTIIHIHTFTFAFYGSPIRHNCIHTHFNMAEKVSQLNCSRERDEANALSHSQVLHQIASISDIPHAQYHHCFYYSPYIHHSIINIS